MKRVLLAFAAGFLATLLFHQPTLWLLQAIGFTDRTAYVMNPVPPLGVPSVLSLAFWGGVWGIPIILAAIRLKGSGYWILSIVAGAILPTLVAGLVIMPLRGQKLPGPAGKLLIFGLAVNAAWGFGTALFYKLFAPSD